MEHTTMQKAFVAVFALAVTFAFLGVTPAQAGTWGKNKVGCIEFAGRGTVGVVGHGSAIVKGSGMVIYDLNFGLVKVRKNKETKVETKGFVRKIRSSRNWDMYLVFNGELTLEGPNVYSIVTNGFGKVFALGKGSFRAMGSGSWKMQDSLFIKKAILRTYG